MTKITLIGAGSVVFVRNLCSDFLLVPALQDSTITLMDIDAGRLRESRDLVQAMIDRRGLRTGLEATTDRREAVTGADYVVTTFQQGGLTAYALDIEIPQRYGVEQCVGDTLGPGGVFRALRTIPVLVSLGRELDEVAPNALLLQYTNPMAANCWAYDVITGRPHVGLCHSIQESTALLSEWAGVPESELSFLAAGINHMAFFLKLCHGQEDLYPRIWAAAEQPDALAREPVRLELMKHFGYFCTESSGHNSEYVPYFRKNNRMVNEELAPRFLDEPNHHWFDYGRTGGYLRHCRVREDESHGEYQALIAGEASFATERSIEYSSYLIEALETGRPAHIYGNVPNHGLVPNLPAGCCVEVPCVVDGAGVHPVAVGPLPAQVAALVRSNVSVQELMVEATRYEDLDAVYQAVMLDPLTAAVCTLPQIHAMVDEMLAAQARWLPRFARNRRPRP